MLHRSLIFGALLLLLANGAAALRAEEPETPRAELAVEQWPMERVLLRDGRSLFGLVQRQDQYTLELIEVRRPPGKPTQLVLRPLDRGRIDQVERLDDAERRRLEARIEQFRNRTRIMSALEESVRLTRMAGGNGHYWRYEGPWFRFDSTADEETTRRSVVRVEQMFGGYRICLEPRRTPTRPLHIVLLGTMEEYGVTLQHRGISIKNPAFFVPQENLIVAGSDLAQFSAEVQRARAHHKTLLQRRQRLHAEATVQLRALNEQMLADGVPDAKRRLVLRGAEKQSRDALDQIAREVAAADRKNQALFAGVTETMFTRLAHEAFHAYLENYLYDAEAYQVPRWINEGLAQVFESSVIELDALRVDAPNVAALQALQRDLRNAEPLPLAELLQAPDEAFLAGHQNGVDAANRYYFYSWGVAHYLTFEQQILNSDRLARYLQREQAEAEPIRRFERLVGQPLAEFEPAWRDYILRLSEQSEAR